MPDPVTYTDKTPANGIIPLRLARKIAFGIIMIALASCTTMSLLAIWDYMARDALWRSLATVVVIVATGLFTVVNEHFGRDR